MLRNGEMSAFYATFLVSSLVVALSSILLFAFSGKRRWINIAALGICSVVLHSGVTGQPTWFIRATIERLGYSYGSQVMRVVLNESGCAIVNMAFGSTAAKPPVVAPTDATCVFDADKKWASSMPGSRRELDRLMCSKFQKKKRVKWKAACLALPVR